MYTLATIQPQVIVPVNQVISALSSRHSSAKNVMRTSRCRQASKVCGRSAANSLSQGINGCLQDLGIHNLSSNSAVSITDPLLPWLHRNTVIEGSSNDSFFVNKHGCSEAELRSATYSSPRYALLPFSSAPACIHPNNAATRCLPNICEQQTRGFKTKRSSSFQGIGAANSPDTVSMRSLLKGSILGSLQPQKADPMASSKLRSLLDEQSSEGVQEHLKLSFAEGYVAGQDSGTKSMGGSDPWSKRVYKFVAIIVIVFAIYYIAFPLFVALYSKSTRFNNIFADTGSLVKAEEVEERFSDIKGADEAQTELQDVVEFLKNPDRFTVLGAKLPKGVLLCGPPGIGKTLLARAVAGEADVPFIYASGSEFDEIFVGVGAKKIRDLFNDAKTRAPCVIFLDEIDAVGSKRVNSETHPYANQTINQLLTEMDGFKQNEGIIILGATNRRDNLDKALMRPGRFDMEIHMQPPDYKGRMDIFDLYLSKVKAAEGIDLERLARATSGYTGADIANVVNQGAIHAALNNSTDVSMEDLEFARDKITMGPMKKTRVPDEETNKVTAYHEAGHALVAYYTKDATSPHKVTIMPRGQSLGHTAFIPEKDQYNMTKLQLLSEMDVALGGRVAEELTFGPDKITTGASSDFQKANGIAEALVKKLGMSEKVGFRIIEDKDLLRGSNQEYSSATLEIVDHEIKRLLQESYDRCRSLLRSHQSELRRLSEALLQYETLDKQDIKNVIEGKKVVRKPSRPPPANNFVATGTNKKAIQAIIEGTKFPNSQSGTAPAQRNTKTSSN